MENWVKARHECSPFEIFVQLRSGVEADVKGRMRLLSKEESVGFKVVRSLNEESFTVIREGHKLSASVEFRHSQSGISVRRGIEKAGDLEATLTLDDDFECRLKVEDELLTPAQFRKRALEDLFFTFPEVE